MAKSLSFTRLDDDKEAPSTFGYAEEALKRVEKRKLERFINMADFRMCDAMTSLLKNTLNVQQHLRHSVSLILGFRRFSKDGYVPKRLFL